jgi:predicted methyltransferase
LQSSTFDDGSLYEDAEVRRDHTATVISTHRDGEPVLLVNGVGITVWTPITKMMAHLPLAARTEPAKEALVICFGMGTTLRSIASWGVPVTAVELVPSVLDAFGYYFDDASEVLARPDVTVVIDDGRRFLKRTDRKFDMVTIDPPPPPQTAGSSLLYSVEFYDLLKRRMTDDAILQHWFPGAEPTSLSAVTRALKLAFPHVRIFRSFEGWGFHFLASKKPLPPLSAERMLARLPDGARRDLAEWVPENEIPGLFEATMAFEVPARRILNQKPAPEISDDRPINEYYLLRHWLDPGPARPGR